MVGYDCAEEEGQARAVCECVETYAAYPSWELSQRRRLRGRVWLVGLLCIALHGHLGLIKS